MVREHPVRIPAHVQERIDRLVDRSRTAVLTTADLITDRRGRPVEQQRYVAERRVQESRHGNLWPMPQPPMGRRGMTDEHIVEAYVNAYLINPRRWIVRWVARCELVYDDPDDPCRNAEIVDPDQPRFFCTWCGNRAAAGLYRWVRFPLDREDGEAVLLARPQPRTRNWERGQTVDELVAENDANDDPVPARLRDGGSA